MMSVFDWSKVSVADSILALTADLTPTPPYRAFTTLASIGPFARRTRTVRRQERGGGDAR